jgi:hypothetical protein
VYGNQEVASLGTQPCNLIEILWKELVGPVGGGAVHGRREEHQDFRGGHQQTKAAFF